MNEDLMEKIMSEVMKKMEDSNNDNNTNKKIESSSLNNEGYRMTEFVGKTKYGKTIGLVIANLDKSIHDLMELLEREQELDHKFLQLMKQLKQQIVKFVK
jgi:hypothetical protein